MTIPPEALKILTTLGPVAGKEIIKLLGKNPGSKVKMGAYQGCPITLFGNKACIVTNADNGEVVFLTSDTIEDYSYIKEKKRLAGVTLRTYFYYDIKFKNGSESYIRMRRKYRDAMFSHM